MADRKTKPRAGFAGTPAFVQPILASLLAAGFRVPLVITQPDRLAGRSPKPVPSPIAEYAATCTLPVVKPERISDAAADLQKADLDVLVVAAYGQILPPAILALPRHGCLNLHWSLLPAYRGTSPVQQTILDGQAVTGTTLMMMDEGVDSGPILAATQVVVTPEATAGSLTDELVAAGAGLLTANLESYLGGTLQGRPQGPSPTPPTHRLRKEDGRLDWTRPADYLERQVRAMQPWPTAFDVLDGEPLQILSARVTKDHGAPGVFDEDFRVGTGAGSLELQTVRPAGKRPMTAQDFLRGYRGSRSFATPRDEPPRPLERR